MGFDPVGILGVLVRHRVRFIVIGGVAGRLWGSPTLTGDLDVCPERTAPNLRRLSDALGELDATLRDVDVPVPFRRDARSLAAAVNLTLTTNLGSLDLIGSPGGVRDFEELASKAAVFDLGDGLSVPVCDLDDLIRMKQASGRPKDRIELEVLGAVQDELHKAGG